MNTEARATTPSARLPRPLLRLVPGAATALQLAGLALVLFGDIGFDRPGRYGLDFGHLLLIVVVVALAWVTAVVCAAVARSRAWLLIQAAMLLAGVLAAGALFFLDR